MPVENILGDLPEGWEVVSLGDACMRGGGNVQTGPFGSQLHASDYVPSGIPVIMPVNIGDNRIQTDGIARIRPEDAQRLSRHLLQVGDIVYSRRGDVERRALIRPEESGWLCGTGCLRVRFGKGVVDPAFASFQLGHPAVRAWIVRHAVGATMPNLNTGILEAVPFVVPPFPVQLKIAAILAALGDRIVLSRRMNQTLEAMARAIFKSWFVDFDPVREGHPLFPPTLQTSRLGPIPAGWRIDSLLEQADLLSGGTPKTSEPEYWGGEIPWASAGDVSQCSEVFLVETQRAITRRGLEESATQIIPSWSTVVVARGATTGRHVMFGEPMAMNQTCYALCSKFGADLALYCQIGNIIGELVHASHGSVFDTITTRTFQAHAAVLPDRNVLLDFDEKMRPFFELILCNQKESLTLAALRDALLPKLLSGEIRVKQAEKIVGEVV